MSWKDLLAIYGGLRLWDDLTKKSSGPPPSSPGDDETMAWGCGCAIVLAVIIVICVNTCG